MVRCVVLAPISMGTRVKVDFKPPVCWPDVGVNIAQRKVRSAPPEIQTSMAWDGGEGSMEGQQAYGDGYAAEMPP